MAFGRFIAVYLELWEFNITLAASRGLGDVDQVLEWLERAVEERDAPVICGLKSERRYAPLREHPRYQALLRKINLGRFSPPALLRS